MVLLEKGKGEKKHAIRRINVVMRSNFSDLSLHAMNQEIEYRSQLQYGVFHF